MSAGTRRKSRELAMQMLFQADLGKQTPDQVRATFWKSVDDVEPEVRGFAEDLFNSSLAHQEKIDELLVANSRHWRLERMPAVDRNLLRMAVGEMLAFKSTPFPIVINEALEIARRYSAPESINFLNGILDAIARGLLPK
ncbi:transcription antitermination factor NusB [Telmatobacter sp. DSM 110680]|uniref:Transcription antitermination protein NusB n=1 Tax=Telmatobacter sp. DSM 110680 TaxID=3036704 RepID=A0AAU7DMC0_9BACT